MSVWAPLQQINKGLKVLCYTQQYNSATPNRTDAAPGPCMCSNCSPCVSAGLTLHKRRTRSSAASESARRPREIRRSLTSRTRAATRFYIRRGAHPNRALPVPAAWPAALSFGCTPQQPRHDHTTHETRTPFHHPIMQMAVAAQTITPPRKQTPSLAPHSYAAACTRGATCGKPRRRTAPPERPAYTLLASSRG